MTQPRRLLAVFALLLALAGGGCALLETLGLYEPHPTFSHALHAKEDLECKDCHSQVDKGDHAGMPKMKQCMLCHEEKDKDLPPERRLATLYGEKPQWTPVPLPPADLIYSHKLHTVDLKLACATCHPDSEDVTKRIRVSMVDTCMACHARQPLTDVKDEAGKRVPRASLVANECAVCHREIRKDIPPASHEFTTDRPPRSHQRIWREVHGQVSRDSKQSKDRCSLCHTQETCSECHRREMPSSHTGFWRYRGHGVAVDMNRSSCAVCHRSDFCDRCHRETAPRSHVGGWGAPRDNHCYSCHGLARSQGCAMCHRGAPGHLEAPPKPSWHSIGMNCRSCHFPLPHADNGMDCNACHR
jgi:hypothetical protein